MLSPKLKERPAHLVTPRVSCGDDGRRPAEAVVGVDGLVNEDAPLIANGA